MLQISMNGLARRLAHLQELFGLQDPSSLLLSCGTLHLLLQVL